VANVGVKKVAMALGVTPRRVQQLAQEGMPHGDGRGKYDLAQCMLWYIRYLQKVIDKRESPQGSIGDSLRTQRERLVSAQADREELELSKLRGELIPVSLFEQVMSKQITSARQRLLTLPGSVAHMLEGETRDVIKVRLTAEIRTVLNSMGEQDANKAGSTGERSDGGSAASQVVGAAATNDGKRVGRQKSRTD
jgi:phage terminase Nu1 subunit (DNA packaging protein)